MGNKKALVLQRFESLVRIAAFARKNNQFLLIQHTDCTGA